jgi:hypothetical protein
MSSCFSFTVRQTFWALEQIIFSHLILGGLRANLWCKENLHNSFKHLAFVRWTGEVCSLGGEEICQEAQKLPEPPVKI